MSFAFLGRSIERFGNPSVSYYEKSWRSRDLEGLLCYGHNAKMKVKERAKYWTVIIEKPGGKHLSFVVQGDLIKDALANAQLWTGSRRIIGINLFAGSKDQ